MNKIACIKEQKQQQQQQQLNQSTIINSTTAEATATKKISNNFFPKVKIMSDRQSRKLRQIEIKMDRLTITIVN